MSEKTIHFDTRREAQDVTGNGASLLARIGEALGVTLTTRDAWLQIKGDDDKLKAAERFFACLRDARSGGTVLREQGILYALEAFAEGRGQDLDRLHQTKIEVSRGKTPVKPKTFGQQLYCDAIRTKDIAFGIGPAGTGKTYLAMAMAVSALLEDKVGRIILTRPAIEAGETLGFLPGDMNEKVYPYLRPLYDALYDMMSADDVERFTAKGLIEVAPLAYMRGRTLNHAFVILDEAQNTTQEQMLMFLTRLGYDSKCVVTGDLTQIDLPESKVSGLLEAQRILMGIKGIAVTELTDADVVRHPLVQNIIRAYRESRANGNQGASLKA